MAAKTTLNIVSDEESAEKFANTFFIPKEIGEFEESDKKDLFYQLSQFEISSRTKRPLYQISWPHILLQSRGNLLEYIILFQRLDRRVQKESPETMHCHNIPKKYHSVIADVGEKYGISTNSSGGRNKPGLYYTVITSALILFIDQILFLPYKIKKLNINTIIYVYGGKIDKISDVIKSHNGEKVSLVSWLNIRYILDSVVRDHGTDINILPINLLVGVTELRHEILFFINYLHEIRTEEMVQGLENQIMEEMDIKMERTVQQSVWYAYRNDVRMILTGIAAGSLQRKFGPKNILYHGPSPRERTIMKESNDSIDQYYLPHGIGGVQEPIPDQQVTQFAPGIASIRYLQAMYDSKVPDLVNTGLPHLSKLYENNRAVEKRNSDNRIMVATQPFDDPIRKKYIKIILQSVAESNTSYNVVIKTHPIEDIEFYNELLSELIPESELDVVVTDKNLINNIKRSGLVITMNSNVGLESIICKTPCVSIIPWGVLTPPIYVQQGPVFQFNTSEEITTFFSNLNTNCLDDMFESQYEFIMNDFALKKDAAHEICEYLQ